MGIPIFLTFAPKHRLSVLVYRTASYCLSKNKNDIKIFLLTIFNFYNLRNSFTLYRRVFVMKMVCVISYNNARLLTTKTTRGHHFRTFSQLVDQIPRRRP